VVLFLFFFVEDKSTTEYSAKLVADGFF